jgi:16S rRNA (uracil1498-N3)-methyltransferase
MTPPLFVVADLGSADTITLTGAEAHHAATVKRLEPGERVLLADGRGGVADAEVRSVARDRVVLAVLTRREVAAPRPRFVVAQALPKGERADLAVEILTELGVDEILPWAAARSIALWKGDKADRGVQKWQRTALEAAKQSRRARVPQVGPLTSTAELARRIAGSPLALVLHEDAELPLTSIAPGEVAEVLLVVGPEGGLTPQELTELGAHGARPVRLGGEVLRTSTAGAAALAVLSAAAGRWR